MSRTLMRIAMLMVAASGVAGVAAGGQPKYQSSKGGFSIILDEPCPANDLPPIDIAFFSSEFDIPGGSESAQCTATASNKGQVIRNGVSVSLAGEILDLEGDTLSSLPGRTRSLNPYGRFSWPYSSSPGGTVVAIQGMATGNRLVDQLQVDCRGQSRVPCVRDLDTSCVFGNGRFEVEAKWRSPTGLRSAEVRRIAGTRTEFAFLSPDRTELILEVLNRCRDNNHFWVFYSATTSVGWEVTVTDTQSGAVRSYDNGLGGPAPTITDTSAFATCP